MRSVPLHLNPGDDVRRSLEQLARQQKASGFVLSVVGNLSQASFQCPGKKAPTLLRGELEIITLQGTLAADAVHLHLSFSDGDCRVWGGHLEYGAKVLKGADLLVGLLDETSHTDSASESIPAAAPQAKVEIAIRPGCPFSARALRMLRTLGIPYTLIEPRGSGTVPQLFIDGHLIGGYDALADLHGRGELEGLRQH